MKTEYQKPDYEIILLSRASVITSSDPWGTEDFPIETSRRQQQPNVWE